MKNLISTLIISSILSAHASADHRLSDLRIRTFDNKPVIVSLNHVQYNTPGTAVTINDIMPGRHQLQVWTYKHRYYPYHPQRVLLYSGFIDVPASSEVRAMVTRQRGLRINEIIPLFTPPAPVPPYYNPYPAPYPAPYPLPAPGPCGTPAAPQCINDADFNALLNTIDNQSFESTRMTLSKQAIRQHGVINSRQVAELMNLMSFESSKLELAKYAYQYTIDPQNYFQLFNAFSFDSSVRELSEYIDRHS
ncbi:MAG: DUF4476 domain-containing protein [Bacteroidetes bacterium]|nr:DUF4476 domain-containing protein [Bacteroidota bacterium]